MIVVFVFHIPYSLDLFILMFDVVFYATELIESFVGTLSVGETSQNKPTGVKFSQIFLCKFK